MSFTAANRSLKPLAEKAAKRGAGRTGEELGRL
jgi:hypothetical protein